VEIGTARWARNQAGAPTSATVTTRRIEDPRRFHDLAGGRLHRHARVACLPPPGQADEARSGVGDHDRAEGGGSKSSASGWAAVTGARNR
jgi:hypothetical protein